MDSEWSVAATKDDPVLFIPWHDETGASHFIDLHTDLTLIDQIPEARTSPPLRAALLSINRKASPLRTAKCDFWTLAEEEKQLDFEVFPSGFGAYIDVIPQDPAIFSSLSNHVSQAQSLSTAAMQIQVRDARTEFVIRPATWDGRDGFSTTVYVYGYGATEEAALAQWTDALHQVVALLAPTSTANQTLE